MRLLIKIAVLTTKAHDDVIIFNMESCTDEDLVLCHKLSGVLLGWGK